MFRNMVTSFLDHGKITTTDAKAKELRSIAEKMITLGKRGEGDLHAIRQWLETLLHIEDSPERTAAAYALGVLLGFSPLLGSAASTLIRFSVAVSGGLTPLPSPRRRRRVRPRCLPISCV